MKKRILSVFLTVCLLASIVPFAAPLKASADGAYMLYTEPVGCQYYKAFQDDIYEYSYSVPEFNPIYLGFNKNSPNIKENISKVNQKIYHDLYDGETGIQGALDCMENGYSVTLRKVDYDYAEKDNVVSLLTKKELLWGGICFYNTYNVSLLTGEELTAGALVKIHGWEMLQYKEAVKAALADCFQEQNNGAAGIPGNQKELEKIREKTLSTENITAAKPYLNEDNELCIVGTIYTLTGAEAYEYLLNLEDYASNPSSRTPFSDVADNAYYADAVAWAAENEITLGTDKTHFSPEQRCTRGQIVTFLWRALGKTEPNSGLQLFSDVKTNEYYEKAVRWAVEEGITNGTGNGKFSPEEGCTRAQAVTFLWRAAGEPEPSRTAKSFSDVKQGSYYEKAVKWAVEKGITAGTGNGKFSPEARCTRAQIVSFLYRAYH